MVRTLKANLINANEIHAIDEFRFILNSQQIGAYTREICQNDEQLAEALIDAVIDLARCEGCLISHMYIVFDF